MSQHAVDATADRLSAHQIIASHKPVMTLTQFSGRTGVPVTTLRNWIDRSLFVFDSDLGREAGKHRRFSRADGAKVWLAAALTRQAVSATEAALVASLVVARVLRAEGRSPGDDLEPLVFVDAGRTPARILTREDALSLSLQSPAVITISTAKIVDYIVRNPD